MTWLLLIWLRISWLINKSANIQEAQTNYRSVIIDDPTGIRMKYKRVIIDDALYHKESSVFSLRCWERSEKQPESQKRGHTEDQGPSKRALTEK